RERHLGANQRADRRRQGRQRRGRARCRRPRAGEAHPRRSHARLHRLLPGSLTGTMLRFLELLASFPAALFAGAALYINVVEHPARMTLETRAAALQWAPSYKRATWLQAPLALVSCLVGVA